MIYHVLPILIIKCSLRGEPPLSRKTKQSSHPLPFPQRGETPCPSGSQYLVKNFNAFLLVHRQPMLAVSPSTEEKTTGKTTGKTGAKARDRVLALIRANPEITVKQLAEVIGLSTHGVDWHIRKLKQQGWLKRIGSRKAGRWEVLG